MSKELEILEVVSQPWMWVPDVDGTPTQEVADTAQSGSPDGCLRHLSHAFASRSPDAVFDRVSVDLGKLRSVIAEVENAVYAMIGGRANGVNLLKSAGEALSRMVFPAWVSRRLFGLQEGTPFIVRPDELAASIPFELCYDAGLDRFLCGHLAMARGVASRRRISLTEPRSARSDGRMDLNRAVVALNPENDARLSSATATAATLNSLLPDGYGAWLSICSGSPLPEFLSLLSTPCFIYTGHIRYRPELGSYIECSDGHRLNSSEIGQRLKGGAQPALAVLNGCGGDRVDELLDIGRSATRAGFARAFYESGSLVAMGARWEVDLATASALNKSLLLNVTRPDPLPIGEWLRRFRLACHPGWACYALYGDPQTTFQAGCQACPVEVQRLPPQSHRLEPPVTLAPCVPTWRAPLFVGLAIEASEQDRGTTAEKNLSAFLDALVAEMNRLEARLAPHGGKAICHLGVECCPRPFSEWVQLHLSRQPGPRTVVERGRGASRDSGTALETLQNIFTRWARGMIQDSTPPLIVLLLTGGGLKRMMPADPDGQAKGLDLQRGFMKGLAGAHEAPPIWIVALDAEAAGVALPGGTGGEPVYGATIDNPACCPDVVRRLFSRYEPLARGAGRGERSSGGEPA